MGPGASILYVTGRNLRPVLESWGGKKKSGLTKKGKKLEK
jgi:hypothetical protein